MAEAAAACAAVVVAGGSGRRFEGEGYKQLADLGGAPVLRWAVEAFAGHPAVGELVVVVPAALAETPPTWLAEAADAVVEGGRTRQESVSRGVAAVSGAPRAILVHDGVRPFVSEELIGRVCAAAVDAPVIPALAVADTVKEVDGEGRIVRTLPRERLRRAQTPQGFPAALLRRLHAGGEARGATDDALLCERSGVQVVTVPGEPYNLKITTLEDLEWARWLLDRGEVSRTWRASGR